MSRTAPRRFTVLAKALLTPNMWRITLGGDGMHGFPPATACAHIKLCFAQAGSSRPLRRTYTVRRQRADAIDIDVVRHAHGGPASRWAEAVVPGEIIEASGPGNGRPLDHSADWFLLTGDMTALPAIGAQIEALPDSACGRAVIEVIHADDIQSIDGPDALAIDWHINPKPGERADLLAQAVREMTWQPGRASVWAACEFQAVRALRRHFVNERTLEPRLFAASSYWQFDRHDG